MSDQPEKPGKRWIIVKFFEHAIERTEDEIAELKAGRLWVRDASGPDDKQHPAEAPAEPPGPELIPAAAPRPAAAPAAPAKAAQ
jgi:hypothetical protein